MSELICLRCGGLNGSHAPVHTRHGNGGGSNRPCPKAPCPGFEWDSWSDAPITDQGCTRCGRRHYGKP